jgi:hypothetical protein
MDKSLEAIGELLDELAPKTAGTADQICEAFVQSIRARSARELEQYANAFDQLGAASLAEMCRTLASEKPTSLH